MMITFTLFCVLTFAASKIDEFWPVIIKGTLLGVIIWPPIYNHYNDVDQYKF